MADDLSVHEDEVPQKSGPPWLAWYRRYLYLALVLSALGLLMAATVWGIRGIGGAMLDVVVASILIRSLKRLSEKRTAMLHLVFNGATLLTAVIFISGNYAIVRSTAGSLLMTLSVDFYATMGLLIIEYNLIELVFLFLSVYWLKNWFQFFRSIDDDNPSGDPVGQDSGDNDTVIAQEAREQQEKPSVFRALRGVVGVAMFAAGSYLCVLGIGAIVEGNKHPDGGIVIIIGLVFLIPGVVLTVIGFGMAKLALRTKKQ